MLNEKNALNFVYGYSDFLQVSGCIFGFYSFWLDRFRWVTFCCGQFNILIFVQSPIKIWRGFFHSCFSYFWQWDSNFKCHQITICHIFVSLIKKPKLLNQNRWLMIVLKHTTSLAIPIVFMLLYGQLYPWSDIVLIIYA